MLLERVIAHRGASAYAPENTLSAFNKARTLGSRFIEFDVMLSQDDEPFVFHDTFVNRTTNGRGKFETKTAEEIRKLDAGKWFSEQYRGEPVPPFSDVLQWMLQSNVQANIEIKPTTGKAEETTVKVLTTLNRYWPTSTPWPLISSFELSALTLCRSLSPEMPLGMLLHRWDASWEKTAKELSCYSVHLSCHAATKARVHEIKEKGYQVLVYTVNRKRLAQRLFDWGVDAVFSDYPDLLA